MSLTVNEADFVREGVKFDVACIVKPTTDGTIAELIKQTIFWLLPPLE